MVLTMKMTTTMMTVSDVKDDLIVDTRRRLEQHNIMSSTTGATARRKIKTNTEELQEWRMRAARP